MYRTLRLLFRIERQSWLIPLIILLGIISAFAEGLGISLFIPLLEDFITQEEVFSFHHNHLLHTLDQLSAHLPEDSRLFWLSFIIFACILLKTGILYTNTVLLSWFNASLGHRLRSQIFHQLLHVGYGFLEVTDSGKLINTLAAETWQVERAVSVSLGLISSGGTILIFVLLLLLISWRLTLLAAIAMIVISTLVQFLTRHVKTLGKQAVVINEVLTRHMWEGLAGMRVIRAFGQEHYEQRQFDRASQQVQRVFFRLDVWSGLVDPLSEAFSAALLLIILSLSLNQYAAGSLPVFLTFVFVLYRLQPQVKMMDGCRVALLSLDASVEAVEALLDPADKPYTRSGSMRYARLQNAIALECVSFRYAPDQPLALRQVSLQIPRGKTTALVGPSGAGKSTLIDLLCRLYEPTAGTIRVDRHPLHQLNLKDWRAQMAMVSQDVYLFDTSIRDNIMYGRLDASEDDIVAAAVQAHAHDFILQLPEGYDTKVGDRGTSLSGGQRQRIALARAILRNPDILILDEATNALDSIAESLIQEALETLSRDRTVIVVAHRLSTIERADQIIVLQEGQIVEQGTLPELLKREGLFTQMYRLQHRSSYS